jgi:hypothetical protein
MANRISGDKNSLLLEDLYLSVHENYFRGILKHYHEIPESFLWILTLYAVVAKDT